MSFLHFGGTLPTQLMIQRSASSRYRAKQSRRFIVNLGVFPERGEGRMIYFHIPKYHVAHMLCHVFANLTNRRKGFSEISVDRRSYCLSEVKISSDILENSIQRTKRYFESPSVLITKYLGMANGKIRDSPRRRDSS